MTSQQRHNKVVLTGADYFTGHEIARHLLRNHRRDIEGRLVAAGVHVERLKDLERQGAEIAKLNPDDVNQMEEVFRNSDWVVVEPIPENHRVELTRRTFEAIKKANVKNVILISCAGAENSERWRHLNEYAEIERDFKNANFSYHTVLRIEFPQNWFHAWSYPVEDKGQFPLSTGQEKRFPPIRLEDVSHALKDILREDGGNRHHKQWYTLTGPETLTGTKIVEELNRAVGTRVQYVDVDRNQLERILRDLREQLQKQQQQRGTRPQSGDEEESREGRFEDQPTDTQIQTILDHFDWVKAGNAERTTDDLKKIIGKEGDRIESFFRDNAAEFRPRRA